MTNEGRRERLPVCGRHRQRRWRRPSGAPMRAAPGQVATDHLTRVEAASEPCRPAAADKVGASVSPPGLCVTGGHRLDGRETQSLSWTRDS
jgi:hypothetical protein